MARTVNDVVMVGADLRLRLVLYLNNRGSIPRLSLRIHHGRGKFSKPTTSWKLASDECYGRSEIFTNTTLLRMPFMLQNINDVTDSYPSATLKQNNNCLTNDGSNSLVSCGFQYLHRLHGYGGLCLHQPHTRSKPYRHTAKTPPLLAGFIISFIWMYVSMIRSIQDTFMQSQH